MLNAEQLCESNFPVFHVCVILSASPLQSAQKGFESNCLFLKNAIFSSYAGWIAGRREALRSSLEKLLANRKVVTYVQHLLARGQSCNLRTTVVSQGYLLLLTSDFRQRRVSTAPPYHTSHNHRALGLLCFNHHHCHSQHGFCPIHPLHVFWQWKR